MRRKSFSIVFGRDTLEMAQTSASSHGHGTNLEICLRVVLATTAIGQGTIPHKSLKIEFGKLLGPIVL